MRVAVNSSRAQLAKDRKNNVLIIFSAKRILERVMRHFSSQYLLYIVVIIKNNIQFDGWRVHCIRMCANTFISLELQIIWYVGLAAMMSMGGKTKPNRTYWKRTTAPRHPGEAIQLENAYSEMFLFLSKTRKIYRKVFFNCAKLYLISRLAVFDFDLFWGSRGERSHSLTCARYRLLLLCISFQGLFFIYIYFFFA